MFPDVIEDSPVIEAFLGIVWLVDIDVVVDTSLTGGSCWFTELPVVTGGGLELVIPVAKCPVYIGITK